VSPPILEARDIKKHYPIKTIWGRLLGVVHALENVSFSLEPEEILGVVGESGCGKSTLARIVLRLEKPTSGTIFFHEKDIFSLEKKELKEFRKKVQIVFQDPFAALNPRMKIGTMLAEPLIVHKLVGSKKEAKEKVKETLSLVGLLPSDMDKYPHQFSGGERQRIGIARALILDPEIIVADEPTSSLDVFVQAQVINLLLRLKEQKGLAYIFISHNLSLVGQIADRTMVLYLGRVVEIGPAREVVKDPLHPYTKLLVDSIPIPDPLKAHLDKLPPLGELPSALALPPGCAFHPRCPIAMPVCKDEPPKLKKVGNREVSCHRYT